MFTSRVGWILIAVGLFVIDVCLWNVSLHAKIGFSSNYDSKEHWKHKDIYWIGHLKTLALLIDKVVHSTDTQCFRKCVYSNQMIPGQGIVLSFVMVKSFVLANFIFKFDRMPYPFWLDIWEQIHPWFSTLVPALESTLKMFITKLLKCLKAVKLQKYGVIIGRE